MELEVTEEPNRPTVKTRETWSKQTDFVVTMLGFMVGYGNLWRFPYICQRNGGGAFLIPFVFFLVTCGLQMMYLEMAIGQFLGKSAAHVFSACPIFKGVGVGQLVLGAMCVICYQQILGWNLFYVAMSCSRSLPWASCDNEWNTDKCIESAGARNITEVNETNSAEQYIFAHTASEEFWQLKVLGISDGVEHMGKIQWHLAVSLLASWVAIYFCLIKGVRSAGKVVYVTAFIPYILLVALLIRTALLPGAVDGILFYLNPDFKKLLEFQVWLEAFLQVFYSLGPAWGVIIVLASYNRFHYQFQRKYIWLTLASEGTSLFSGFVIFTVLGAMAHSAGVDVSRIASSGPGLIFVVFPAGLAKLPVPQLWSFLFFFMMFSVGLDTMFAWVESMTTALIDQYPSQLRGRRALLTLGVVIFYFLGGLIFTTEGGIYFFQVFDWYCASLYIVICALLEIIVFIWIYDWRRLNRDIELMTGHKMSLFQRLMLGYVTPLFILATTVLVLLNYKPPTYGTYVYPGYIEIIGWTLAIIPIIPIPIMAAVTLWKSSGTFKQRLSKCCHPEPAWKPSAMKYWEMYTEEFADKRQKKCSCLSPLKP